MRFSALAALMASVCLLSGVARASRTVTGTVFVDRDGDGLFSARDEVFTDGVVFWETHLHAPLDERGRFELSSVPDQVGILWVLGQGGLDPGPFWARVPAGDDRIVDIAVRPLSVVGDLTFVIGSDTHAGISAMSPSDQAFVLRQAVNIEPPPHFIAITGDITQSNMPDQFATVEAAIAGLDTPYVPVPGNHDWYDGGATYREHFGPPSYAFNAGPLHFIVLNDADSLDVRERFVERDLALLGDRAAAVVALMHAPPRDDLVDRLAAHGVETLLTGHMHSNRILVHDTLVEYNTEPLAMGGMDLTPAGYRVFSADADGSLRSVHRTIVERPIVRIVSPSRDQVVPPGRVPVLVALEAGASAVSVDARAMDGERVPLARAGGWVHAGEVELSGPGPHTIEVEVRLAGGDMLVDRIDVAVGAGADRTGTVAVGEWPMLQGSPRHQGASPVVAGFPLETRWTAAVGGHVHGGSPVVAGGRVFVPVSDFAEGTTGGVVAFDAAAGERLWERRVGSSVRNAPAASGDVVVFAAQDGTVHAVDASTGRPRWTYDIAPTAEASSRNLYSAPVIEDGIVYVGARRELVALDLETGDIVWSVVPIDSWGDLASHASPALALGRLVLAFDRGEEGLMAFDAATGDRLWQTGQDIAQGMQGSPVIADTTVYAVNELTDVTALDLGSGMIRWSRRLDEGGFHWGYGAVATPAYRDGTLYVGTQFGQMFALDADTGIILWTHDGENSLIRTSHYRGEIPAYGVAPALTPELVWTANPAGILAALHAGSGHELWSTSLGVPITSSLAPAGSLLYLASFDGTVRAFAARPVVDIPDGRCSVGGSDGPASLFILVAIALFRLRWRSDHRDRSR